jgi:hypothetical protein
VLAEIPRLAVLRLEHRVNSPVLYPCYALTCSNLSRLAFVVCDRDENTALAVPPDEDPDGLRPAAPPLSILRGLFSFIRHDFLLSIVQICTIRL